MRWWQGSQVGMWSKRLEQLVKLLADDYSVARPPLFSTPTNFKKPSLHQVWDCHHFMQWFLLWKMGIAESCRIYFANEGPVLILWCATQVAESLPWWWVEIIGIQTEPFNINIYQMCACIRNSTSPHLQMKGEHLRWKLWRNLLTSC